MKNQNLQTPTRSRRGQEADQTTQHTADLRLLTASATGLRQGFSLLLAGSLLLAQTAAFAASSLETEMTTLAETLAKQIKKSGLKKISVVDFSDLQGNYNELGRFIAENLTVNMVTIGEDFRMVDRSNLKRILEEHKLSMSGLVDPANAKKLGQIAGVDAIIIGNVTPLKTDVSITAKIISTDTAEIVGAGRSSVKRGEEIDQLLDRGIGSGGGSESAGGSSGSSNSGSTSAANKKEFSASATTQKFRDFEVQLLSFKVLPNGTGFAAFQINNTSKTNSVGFAGNVFREPTGNWRVSAKILDEKGNFLRASKMDGLLFSIAETGAGNSGLDCLAYDIMNQHYGWTKKITEVRPTESQRFTLEFAPLRNNNRDELPKLGTVFKLQAELISIQIKEDDNKPTPRLESIYFDNLTITPPGK